MEFFLLPKLEFLHISSNFLNSTSETCLSETFPARDQLLLGNHFKMSQLFIRYKPLFETNCSPPNDYLNLLV